MSLSAIGPPSWHPDLAFVLSHFLIHLHPLALQLPPRKRQQWNCLQHKLENQWMITRCNGKKTQDMPQPIQELDADILIA
jgi:hypothetical protein